MICFVILHYLSIKETQTCISSIKKSIHDDYRIIIVDNASPNYSGPALKKIYAGYENIDIILNQDNYGYAVGNNIGFRYAKEKYHPQFIAIINNDIEITDNLFLSKIKEIYDKEEFDVLGPDIFSTLYDAHQSPKRLGHYTDRELDILYKKYNKSLKNGIYLRLKCFMKKSFWLRKKVYQLKRKKIDYTMKYYNVPLHGACVIFSKKYIEKYNEAFFPKTFFYFEMEILDFLCMKNGLKVVYEPSISVIHHQNVSTDLVYKNLLEKTIFSYKSNSQSVRFFLELMQEMKG